MSSHSVEEEHLRNDNTRPPSFDRGDPLLVVFQNCGHPAFPVGTPAEETARKSLIPQQRKRKIKVGHDPVSGPASDFLGPGPDKSDVGVLFEDLDAFREILGMHKVVSIEEAEEFAFGNLGTEIADFFYSPDFSAVSEG